MALAQLPSTLSPSSMSSFTDCPRLFQYRSIERLAEPASPWTLKGTFVHSALEQLFAAASPASRTEEVALGALDDVVASEDGGAALAGLGLSAAESDRFLADCRSLVSAYFSIEDPRDVNAVGVELRLECELEVGADEPLRVRGIIDRLDLEEGGGLVVVDYKTGRAPAPRHERARLAAVETYAAMCERALGARPVAVRLLHLREPVVIERRIGPSETARQVRRAEQLWRAISAAHATGSYRPSPGPLCRTCAFADRCEGALAAPGTPAGARHNTP